MKRCGIIDLGSNTIRLAVFSVRQEVHRPITKKDFDELITTKKTAGLAGYVVDGVFSAEGVARASSVLRDFLKRAELVGCEKTRIFATAVIRNCKNSKKVLSDIEKAISHPVDLLSGEEEARLDMLGATCDRHIGSGTLVDIGGGSTELVAIRDDEALDMISLDQGSVSSYRKFVRLVFPTRKERAAIRKSIEGYLAKVGRDYKAKTLYGVGGSIRAACKLKAALEGSIKPARALTRNDVSNMIGLLESDEGRFAHKAAQVIPDRMHTVGCALVIVDTLMDALGADEIEVCKFGVREGYLIDRVLSS